jgi:hypothetical protein
MNKKSTFAKMRRDGTLVRVKADGEEETLPAAPPTRRTEPKSKPQRWQIPTRSH